jgi:hypothetical protein
LDKLEKNYGFSHYSVALRTVVIWNVSHLPMYDFFVLGLLQWLKYKRNTRQHSDTFCFAWNNKLMGMEAEMGSKTNVQKCWSRTEVNVKLKIWFLDDNISFIWSKPFFVLCAWSLLLNKDQEHTCIQISVMPLENVKKKIVCGFIIPATTLEVMRFDDERMTAL